MELWSHRIQMYSNHGEHSFTNTACNWSKTQDQVFLQYHEVLQLQGEYHEALIKKQQIDISEELSISTYELGQTVWCFDTMDKIWKPAVILEPAHEPHSYWCKMEDSNQKLRRTRLHITPKGIHAKPFLKGRT